MWIGLVQWQPEDMMEGLFLIVLQPFKSAV